jgi:uncharacterized metal-binding protein (TIGR02443 family)
MIFDRKKRFIAGACCPHCKKLDTVVVFSDAEGDKRLCVACEVEEKLTLTDTAQTVEIITAPIPEK